MPGAGYFTRAGDRRRACLSGAPSYGEEAGHRSLLGQVKATPPRLTSCRLGFFFSSAWWMAIAAAAAS